MSSIRRPWDMITLTSFVVLAAIVAGFLAARQPILSVLIVLVFVGCVISYGVITLTKSPIIPILILCGFGPLPGFARTSSVSLSALITLMVLALLLWYFFNTHQAIEGFDGLWILFLGWAILVTFLAGRFSQGTIQNLAVYMCFFITMALARAHFSSGILTYQALHHAMFGFALLAPVTYWVPSEVFGISATRGFALAALVPICWFSARWTRLFSLDGLIVSSLLLILLSTLSRTAMATALIIIVLSRIDVNSILSIIRVVVSGALAGALAYYLVNSVESLNNRFFTGDVTMSVGGIPINGSGRTQLWEVTLESIHRSSWSYWIGQGAGSASSLIQKIRPGLGHPHNDFLRIWHDFGTVGLTMWLTLWAALIILIIRRWHRSDDHRNVQVASIHRPGLLAALAILPPMYTDNIVVYYFAMLPCAVLIGVALTSHEDLR